MNNLVTVPEALHALRVGMTTFYMLKRLHPTAFPVPKVVKNRHYFYDMAEIYAFIETHAPKFAVRDGLELVAELAEHRAESCRVLSTELSIHTADRLQ